MTLFTVGHSNHPLERFLALLLAFELKGIVDVRAFPTSRRWPHFTRAALAATLAASGIRYDWMPSLGGRRSQGRAGSPHTAWTVPAFRHFADYAETVDFAEGLRQLLALAAERPTAFMCAEAKYWQCHRRLIADHLLLAGHEVRHIESPKRTTAHRFPEFARVVNGRLIYDGGTQLMLKK